MRDENTRIRWNRLWSYGEVIVVDHRKTPSETRLVEMMYLARTNTSDSVGSSFLPLPERVRTSGSWT